MKTHVRRWGNSLAVRLPQAIAEEAALEEGLAVEIVARGKQVLLRPLRRYELGEMLARIRPGNLHHEVPSGARVGREEW
jgi:antitoxin MazE